VGGGWAGVGGGRLVSGVVYIVRGGWAVAVAVDRVLEGCVVQLEYVRLEGLAGGVGLKWMSRR
jgi:hypothetical protein